jgi:hypothetical protein
MPQKNQQPDFRQVVDRIALQLTELVADEVERRVTETLRSLKAELGKGGKVDGRRGGRLCPVPGCGKAGAGPRNRWFCQEHARSLSATEQRSLIERNKRLAAEGKLNAQVPADLVVRLPSKQKRSRRSLDMTCRVDGCSNRSRGPRAGFICDQHRAQLSPEEQKQARDQWNARAKGKVEKPAAPANKVVSPVPPIVRKGAEA